MSANLTAVFSGAPLNNLIGIESNETLVTGTGARARAASQHTINVTRTNGTNLSIAASSSSSAIQFVRFTPKTRFVTTALTLTISGGTGTGKVDIYAYLDTDNTTLKWWVADTSGNTFTFTSQTVSAWPNAQPPNGAQLIWSWTITSGSFDTSGGTDQGTATDCWIDLISLANTTGSAATVTIADSQSSAINSLKTVSIPANSTTVISWPGGKYFESGMFINAGTANAIDAYFRGVRVRRSPGSSGINP